MKQASFLSLQWKDGLKGFITAVATALITSIYSIIQTGGMPTHDQWKVILLSSVSAGFAYLLKNFLTNSDDKLLKKDNPATTITTTKTNE